jgi:hypothetical protein
VKRLLLYLVKKMDYMPVKGHAWRDLQQRLAASEQAASQSRDMTQSVQRHEALIKHLERQRDELAAQLAASREALARADVSGRITALEAENRQLRQRLNDLEAYLKHTRGEGARYYL